MTVSGSTIGYGLGMGARISSLEKERLNQLEISSLIKARINAAHAAMNSAMNTSMMYSDRAVEPRKRRTTRDLYYKWRWRIGNAWSVLIGKADIC